MPENKKNLSRSADNIGNKKNLSRSAGNIGIRTVKLQVVLLPNFLDDVFYAMTKSYIIEHEKMSIIEFIFFCDPSINWAMCD